MIDIRVGDVFDELARIPDESIHCVVTSPPYWGLRDYGIDGQIGLEPTLQQHITTMVRVFEEIRRVLRKDGTCWLNYGDCYCADGIVDERGQRNRNGTRAPGMKPKDLCMIPNRLAIALQDAGWWVRSEIIWAKPNPMPESVTDRPSTAHEKIWLLTKSARYFYDADAVLVPVSPNTHARLSQDVMNQIGSARANGGAKTNGNMKAVARKTGTNHGRVKDNDSFNSALAIPPAKRNLRNVWTIATKPFSEAHFATFPPEIPETCIKAGCPKDGTVLDPFGGAGTTGLVADRLQRNAILIELNPEYADIARSRISSDRGALLDAMESAE